MKFLESRYDRIYIFTMPPKRQDAHLKRAREFAHPPPLARLNAKRYVFSVLVEGLTPLAVERCMLWNDIAPPSHRKFYEVQNEMIPILYSMARESCQKHRRWMQPGTILTLDGSWSHRRNAKRCLVDFIDSNSRKIVDFEIVVKVSGLNEGDYTGPSNGMEREALRRLIPRWKEDTRVVGYCHDNDGKTRKTITDSGWKVEEFLDKNHIMHSFDKAYNNFKKRKLLWGLKEHLRHWMLCLVYEDIALDEKKHFWEVVTVEHFSGHHEHCPEHKPVKAWRHHNDAVHLEGLKEFLCMTSKYLDKCGRLISTQMNESLHALKALYANKLFCWGKAWTARVCVAILQVNEPSTWKMELYTRLQLPPLHFEVEQRLRTILLTQEMQNEVRRKPEFRRRENARRKSQRTANRVSESRCHDYITHPAVTGVGDESSEEEISESEEIVLDRAIADVDEAAPDVFVDDPQDIETNEDAPDGQESSRCRVA